MCLLIGRGNKRAGEVFKGKHAVTWPMSVQVIVCQWAESDDAAGFVQMPWPI